VSQKINTGIAHYNYNTQQAILVIFGRDVAEGVCYQKVICHPTPPTSVVFFTWKNINTNPEYCVFSVMLYTVSRKWQCFGWLCLRHSSTSFNNFSVDNRVVLLSTVCKHYFSPSHFIFETGYTARLKTHNFRGLCFPRWCRGISQNRLICLSYSVLHQCRFLTQCSDKISVHKSMFTY